MPHHYSTSHLIRKVFIQQFHSVIKNKRFKLKTKVHANGIQFEISLMKPGPITGYVQTAKSLEQKIVWIYSAANNAYNIRCVCFFVRPQHRHALVFTRLEIFSLHVQFGQFQGNLQTFHSSTLNYAKEKATHTHPLLLHFYCNMMKTRFFSVQIY